MEPPGCFKLAKEKYNEGKAAISKRQCIKAREILYQVIEQAFQYVADYPQEKNDNTKAMAEVLLETGRQLNSVMDYRAAITCYNTSLCLVINCENICTRYVNIMCSSYMCLIQTLLFLKDIESAVSMMNQYKGYLIDIGIHNTLVKDTLAMVSLDVGMALLEKSMFTSAKDILDKARRYFDTSDSEHAEKSAKLLSVLGYCFLSLNNDASSDHLIESLNLWETLKHPPYECHTILNTMKHFYESLFTFKNHMEYFDCKEVHNSMLNLHKSMSSHGLGMEVADAFTYLGSVAFNRMHEAKAVVCFEQSLTLYRNSSKSDTYHDEVCKLLRYVGVSNFNCRNFSRAVEAYQERLSMYEGAKCVNSSNLTSIAECYAALGFSYSRLPSFENMLKYYEKALELKTWLRSDDLEMIETNIGSLYQVKAVLHKQKKDMVLSHKYFTAAERAFTNALRYSWKSFPFVNYGYYLLCQGQFSSAVHTLQQAYLNGVIDKDTVEFDHTEDPILLEDLRIELDGLNDIRIPAPIVALYLKALAQTRMNDITGAESTAEQLHQEISSTHYDCYYAVEFGQDRMKALCMSLLGYVHSHLKRHADSYAAFQNAIAIYPNYPAAKQNACRQLQELVNKPPS